MPKFDMRPGHIATSDTVQYSDEELEFIKAIDRFKREKRKPFPSYSEVLGVAKSLGYRKVEADQTDLGASDDRPIGPDHPLYQAHS